MDVGVEIGKGGLDAVIIFYDAAEAIDISRRSTYCGNLRYGYGVAV
jgi:hypothetical protein